ncbi:hypothetical protein GTW38_25070 [Streptomyces sp. SID7804]|nr:hypothetical protein [Streptomyces sp. SID7804]
MDRPPTEARPAEAGRPAEAAADAAVVAADSGTYRQSASASGATHP